MDKISTDTVVKYADLLVEDLEKKIAILLGDHFGLVFDSWSEHGERFVGLYGVYESGASVQKSLLAFAPLLEEDDLSAKSYPDVWPIS
jgi:hypothetical protein